VRKRGASSRLKPLSVREVWTVFRQCLNVCKMHLSFSLQISTGIRIVGDRNPACGAGGVRGLAVSPPIDLLAGTDALTANPAYAGISRRDSPHRRPHLLSEVSLSESLGQECALVVALPLRLISPGWRRPSAWASSYSVSDVRRVSWRRILNDAGFENGMELCPIT